MTDPMKFGSPLRMTLDELALKYHADKASSIHNYCHTYERYLKPIRMSARKILEIGAAGGNSLRMWADYFPYAVIHGIDHNPESGKLNLPPERFQIDIGDVCDRHFWDGFIKRWGGDYDLILDDGGHFPHQISDAFVQGWDLLARNGYYIIEDLHFPYTLNEGARLAMRDLFGQAIDSCNEGGQGQVGTWQKPSVTIAEIHFHKSLAIMRKRP